MASNKSRSEFFRKVINAVKAGKTLKELLMIIGMSEDQFWEKERYFSPKNRKAVEAGLAENEARAKKIAKHKKANQKTEETKKTIAAPADPEPQEEAEEPAEQEELKIEIEQRANLEEEERTLSERVMALENERQSFFSRRHEIMLQLKREKEELEVLLKTILEREEKDTSLVEEANTLADKMRDISNKKSPLVARLQAVREMLKSVSVFVYKDGTIEAWRGEDSFELDFSGSDEKEQRILKDRAVYGDLPLGMVTLLAKLLSAKGSLIQKGFELEFSFDREVSVLEIYLD